MVSGGWVLLCVLLVAAWLLVQFRGLWAAPSAGSGGIGAVSFRSQPHNAGNSAWTAGRFDRSVVGRPLVLRVCKVARSNIPDERGARRAIRNRKPSTSPVFLGGNDNCSFVAIIHVGVPVAVPVSGQPLC